MGFPDDTGDEAYWNILKAAEAHGRDSEPEHEVGDLQDAVIAAWGIMSVEQRTKLLDELEGQAHWAFGDDDE